MYRLFLDDVRVVKDVTWVELPLGPWIIARSYNEFVGAIKKYGVPAYCAYDHDLGPQAYSEGAAKKYKDFDYSKLTEKTGMDCAKFLVEFCMNNKIPHPEFTVHSQNPVGADNIRSYINSYNKSLE